MAQIGSYALLLALALSVYSFLAGLVALFRQDEGSERLGETAAAPESPLSPQSCSPL